MHFNLHWLVYILHWRLLWIARHHMLRSARFNFILFLIALHFFLNIIIFMWMDNILVLNFFLQSSSCYSKGKSGFFMYLEATSKLDVTSDWDTHLYPDPVLHHLISLLISVDIFIISYLNCTWLGLGKTATSYFLGSSHNNSHKRQNVLTLPFQDLQKH